MTRRLSALTWPCCALVIDLLTLVEAAFHECIHDSHIVPSLLRHEHYPHYTSQEDADHLSPGWRQEVSSDNDFHVALEGNRTKRVTERRLVAGSGGGALRIHVDYTYLDNAKYQCKEASGKIPSVHDGNEEIECSEATKVTQKKIEYIKKLVEASKEWFEKTLRVVHPTRTALKLQKYCYQYAPPPNGDPETPVSRLCWSRRYAGCSFAVPDTDFYLTVTANPTKGNTLAWALTCSSDDDTGRPIAGLVNFGPSRLTMDPKEWRGELSTAIHEIAHALGFSATKFEDFIDDTGNRLGKDKVVRTFEKRGTTVAKIVTKRVIQEVKKHYACHDWPDAGGELEDFGGQGTAGSHWEKRVFRDEFMTGTDSQNPVYSAISLALFEDSGWYKADYRMAEYFHWGNRAGCTFPIEKCNAWEDKFFCQQEGKGCTHNHISKAYCNVATMDFHLPAHNRYFEDAFKGGRDSHADYCPFYKGYSNGDCRVAAYQKKRVDQIYAEKYGESSRCFSASIMAKKYVNKGMGQRCFETECAGDVLKVKIGGKDYVCPVAGGEVEVNDHDTFRGKFVCPPAPEVCTPSPDPVDSKTDEPDEEPEPVEEEPPIVTPMKWEEDVPVSVESGKTAYFVIGDGSDKATLKRMALKFRGVEARVYVAANADDMPADKVLGEQKATPPKLPSKEYNAGLYEVTSTTESVNLPDSIAEQGAAFYVAVEASSAAIENGVMQLVSRCARRCRNGGTCERGICQCMPGWTGLACDEKQCPEDCNGHGSCDKFRGSCSCDFGWEGLSCKQRTPPSDTPEMGNVKVGEWAYFRVGCPDNFRGKDVHLKYTLTKKGSAYGSDPFLFLHVGLTRPVSSAYTTRDRESWKARLNTHSVSVTGRQRSDGTVATVGVWNTPHYGRKTLEYEGNIECEEVKVRKPCPKHDGKECGGPLQGKCGINKVNDRPVCRCLAGFSGDACEVKASELIEGNQKFSGVRIGQGAAWHKTIALAESVYGKKVRLKIQNAPKWLGISVNAGSRQPTESQPKRADMHNYYGNLWKWRFNGKVSKVSIQEASSGEYSIMVLNKDISPEAVIDLEIEICDGPSQKQRRVPLESFDIEPDDFAKAQDADEANQMDDPSVPLAMISGNGRLPEATLSMSSRTGVEGMASSTEMRLLHVEEFCSQSRTGFYVKCSRLQGHVTICGDQEIVVFSQARDGQFPKDTSDFGQRTMSTLGPPPKKWAHLNSWEDKCFHHTVVDVNEDNHVLGVAARIRGRYVTFQAVFQGKDGFFFNDTGAIRGEWEVVLVALITAGITSLVWAGTVFGWYKYKGKKFSEQNAARQASARRSIDATRMEARMSMQRVKSNRSHRGGHEGPYSGTTEMSRLASARPGTDASNMLAAVRNMPSHDHDREVRPVSSDGIPEP
eukprot:TRINITY_DN51001_c0_g1_i1.p1 TRINITY_DN51001_c0_g1~~TRINITY_DN51001_c0_g1_i1.p1  ORF type:complete len:1399 (-),score=298.14 TRINITY_DN51001_c0_g1_i1:275-4471(-)